MMQCDTKELKASSKIDRLLVEMDAIVKLQPKILELKKPVDALAKAKRVLEA